MSHKDRKYFVGAPQQDDRFLNIDDVMARLGVSRSTIWRLTQSGDFPRSVAISPGRKGLQWLKAGIQGHAVVLDPVRARQRARRSGGGGSQPCPPARTVGGVEAKRLVIPVEAAA